MPKKAKQTAKKAKRVAKKKAGRPSYAANASAAAAANSRGYAALDEDPHALPNTSVTAGGIDLLRTLIERLGLRLDDFLENQQRDRGQQQAPPLVPCPPEPYNDNAIGRLLATTSEIREQNARIEATFAEMQRRVSVLEENQRPPPHVLDGEQVARSTAVRWIFANQCRSANLVRPTPAIIGRAMRDERAFDRLRSKSPQELFLQIYSTVRRITGLSESQPQEEPNTNQQQIHLTEEMVAVIEGRSSRPARKHSTYFSSTLKPRLKLLLNNGMATVEPDHHGERTNYFRYLTPVGREVFDGWPEWSDATGGISLADEPSVPLRTPGEYPTETTTAALESPPPPPPT